MPRFLIFILLVNITYTVNFVCCLESSGVKINKRNDIPPEIFNKDESNNVNAVNDKGVSEIGAVQTFNLNSSISKDSPKGEENSSAKVIGGNNIVEPESNNVHILVPTKKSPAVDSEALLRGFYVFIGLSAITLLYVMYRSYRLRIGGTRPTVVRKYGILTQRTDMEMLPLPLDDDEEDDTVFDVAHHSNR